MSKQSMLLLLVVILVFGYLYYKKHMNGNGLPGAMGSIQGTGVNG